MIYSLPTALSLSLSSPVYTTFLSLVEAKDGLRLTFSQFFIPWLQNPVIYGAPQDG